MTSTIESPSQSRAQAPEPQAPAIWLLLALAGVAFVGHMLVAGNYGYFRDELYYIADGRHLQAGYVDQPLLMGWLAALLHVIAHDNLVAIHIIPALACSLIVVATGLLSREMGGGKPAQFLAGAAALFTVNFMATGSIFSMDVLDQLWWTLAGLVLARMLRRGTLRLWLVFGLIAAIGFLTKLTIFFFGLAVALALLVTPERRHLRTPWPWLAFGIALLGLLPYVIWNAANGWQTLDFYRQYRYLSTGPLGFLVWQIGLMNPVAVPLAAAGLVFYFRRSGRQYRLLGWVFVFLYVMLTVIRAKPYFLSPAYPIVFAAGAVMVEQITSRPRMKWMRPTYICLLALAGMVLATYAMPILPPATFARIYGAFPQPLADRFGWDTLTQTVETVYAALPPEEQAQACVLASNYGEASALGLLAAPGKLPPIVTGHNNYFLWGPGSSNGHVVIAVGSDVQRVAAFYKHVTLAATRKDPYTVEYERELPIYVLSDPKSPDFDLAKIWPSLKHYD